MQDELLFPHDALEAFRRAMLGDRFVPELSAAQQEKVGTLRMDLAALSGPFKTPPAIPVVQRYLKQEMAAGLADPMALPALNTEVAKAQIKAMRSSTGIVLLPADCPLLYSTAAQIENAARPELVSLEETQGLVVSQKDAARARMTAALKTGELPYLAINFTTGEIEEGVPDFWRSDAAKDIWAGKRVKSDGSNAAALMMKSAAADELGAIRERIRHYGHEFGAALRRGDLEAYFSGERPAVAAAVVNDQPGNPRHAEISAAAERLNPGEKTPPSAKEFFGNIRKELNWKSGPSDTLIKEALKGTRHLQKARRPAAGVQPKSAAG